MPSAAPSKHRPVDVSPASDPRLRHVLLFLFYWSCKENGVRSPFSVRRVLHLAFQDLLNDFQKAREILGLAHLNA